MVSYIAIWKLHNCVNKMCNTPRETNKQNTQTYLFQMKGLRKKKKIKISHFKITILSTIFVSPLSISAYCFFFVFWDVRLQILRCKFWQDKAKIKHKEYLSRVNLKRNRDEPGAIISCRLCSYGCDNDEGEDGGNWEMMAESGDGIFIVKFEHVKCWSFKHGYDFLQREGGGGRVEYYNIIITLGVDAICYYTVK